MLDSREFTRERKRARLFFNLTSVLYPAIERYLFPRYMEAVARLNLPVDLPVLDLATGSGILAAAFCRRGHRVTGVDFSRRLLSRAIRRFPEIEFKVFDLVDLSKIPENSYGIVACGYLLHGISPQFRKTILKHMSRIARSHVVVFDYCCDGGWFVRLIEWVEGPHYQGFIDTPREEEFASSGLGVESTFQTSGFGSMWLCRPVSIRPK